MREHDKNPVTLTLKLDRTTYFFLSRLKRLLEKELGEEVKTRQLIQTALRCYSRAAIRALEERQRHRDEDTIRDLRGHGGGGDEPVPSAAIQVPLEEMRTFAGNLGGSHGSTAWCRARADRRNPAGTPAADRDRTDTPTPGPHAHPDTGP